MTEVNEVEVRRGGGMAEGGGLGRLIKLLVIAIVALVLIVGGILIFLKVMGPGEKEVAQAPEAAELRDVATIMENPQYLELGTFIVNLSDGRLYLKTNLTLLISEEKAKAYMEKRIPQMKDMVVGQLQNMTSEQLREGLHRTKLRRALLTQIKTLLPEADEMDWTDRDPIKKVLITEFYLQ